MKKVFHIILTVMLIATLTVPSLSATNAQKTHKYDDYIHYRDQLANTYQKLTVDKKLKVVYFGGSVTAGYGSTNAGLYSWQSLSSAWLRDKFPDADISVVNTAIGESGTFLGTYRLHKDVIAQNPDLLFIEYAINDKYKNSTKEQAALQYETIVREVRAALPNCDIVTLLVIDQSTSKLLPDLYPTAAGHEMIAEAYNIPTVNVGASLVDSMSDPEKEWSTYFIDIVHPTDAGYKKYYDCLEEFLYNSLICEDLSNAQLGHTMPKIQSDHLLDGNRMSLIGIKMRPYLVSSKGFKYVDALYYGPASTPHIGYYTCPKGTTDAEITFRFNGTEISIWTNFYNNSTVDISVDGGSVNRIMCDSHAPTTLVRELAPGEHYITIKPVVFGDGAEEMKIGAVFFRDDTKQSGNAVDPATREQSKGNTTVKENHVHEYGDWSSDSDVHWKECSCSDVTDWNYHTFSKWEQTGDTSYNRTCTVCGYIQEGVLKNGEPVPVEEEYWYEVAVYDTVMNTDRENAEQTKTVQVPVETTKKRKITTFVYTPLFYVLVIGGAVVLAAGITVLVIILVKKRKKKSAIK